jgi:predicted dehydrogenase
VKVHRLGIGLVGAGEIAQAAHIPAYSNNSDVLELRWIFDADANRRESVAEQAGVPAADSLQRLLSDPAVDLIDIAVPPQAQPDIVVAALKAGKHVLAQKPLATDTGAAAELVDLAEERGNTLAVNQQMRWSPAILGYQDFARGRSVEMVEFDLVWPIEKGEGLPRWLADAPRFVGLFNSIHFLDTSRWLFGEPRQVQAWLGPPDIPGIAGESALYAMLRFDRLSVVIRDSRRAEAGHTASMRAVAEDALFHAHLGMWDSYPDPRPDRLVEAVSGSEPTLALTDTSWVPDAFTGAFRHVAEAILSDSAPVISGRDNLMTLRLVDACYQSAEGGGRLISL